MALNVFCLLGVLTASPISDLWGGSPLGLQLALHLHPRIVFSFLHAIFVTDNSCLDYFISLRNLRMKRHLITPLLH